jgi:hypothetical protein
LVSHPTQIESILEQSAEGTISTSEFGSNRMIAKITFVLFRGCFQGKKKMKM